VTRLAVLVVLAALGLATMAFAGARHRLAAGVALCIVALGAVWFASFAAVRSDWRDADGFVDCWPHCSVYQDACGAVLVGSPAVLVVWLAAAGLVAWRRRDSPTTRRRKERKA
jgi:hypothetical protein